MSIVAKPSAPTKLPQKGSGALLEHIDGAFSSLEPFDNYSDSSLEVPVSPRTLSPPNHVRNPILTVTSASSPIKAGKRSQRRSSLTVSNDSSPRSLEISDFGKSGDFTDTEMPSSYPKSSLSNRSMFLTTTTSYNVGGPQDISPRTEVYQNGMHSARRSQTPTTRNLNLSPSSITSISSSDELDGKDRKHKKDKKFKRDVTDPNNQKSRHKDKTSKSARLATTEPIMSSQNPHLISSKSSRSLTTSLNDESDSHSSTLSGKKKKYRDSEALTDTEIGQKRQKRSLDGDPKKLQPLSTSNTGGIIPYSSSSLVSSPRSSSSRSGSPRFSSAESPTSTPSLSAAKTAFKRQTYESVKVPTVITEEADHRNLIVQLVDGEEQVVAGTVDQLVSYFAYQIQDLNFLRQILLAKEQFTTSRKLLSKLIDLFHQTDQTAFDTHTDKSQVQIRIINLIKKWCNTSPSDFENNSVNDKLTTFLDELNNVPETKQWAVLVERSWRSSTAESHKVDDIANGIEEHDDAPPSLSSPGLKKAIESYKKGLGAAAYQSIDLMDIPIEEIARQWTLVDYTYFRKITFTELLNKRWENPETSVNVAAVNTRFNAIIRWVGTTILSETTAKHRAKVLSHFIQIGEKLLQMNNFFGVMSLIFGISHPAIARLSETWSKVSSSTMEKWKNLESVGNPTSNFKVLRASIDKLSAPSSSLPMVPTPTILLRDLLFIEEANEDWYDRANRLINWEKVKLFGKVFSMVKKASDTPYEFKHIAVLKEYLTHVKTLPEDQLEKLSKDLEPR